MQVILIKNNNLRKIILPTTPKGNFWITDLDENGNEKNLINIEANEGRWNLISNLDVYYVKNNKKVHQVILSEYNFYTLKSNNSYIYIYCCPLLDNNSNYYDITNSNQQINIGKNNNAVIYYNLSLLNDIEASIIVKGNYVTIESNKDSKLGVFVNDFKIIEPTLLKNGDYIFISGLKIIYVILKDKMALIINDVNSRTKINLNMIPRIEYPNEFDSQENNDNILAKEDNYFHKNPRFIQILREYNLNIDPPPSKEGDGKTPLILIIGPMITTSMMSVMYGYSAINTIKNNNGDIMSGMMPLVMCVSMLAGTLLWPTITRRYDKKRRIEQEKIRQEKYGKYIKLKTKEIENELFNQKNILINNNPNLQQCQNTILNKTIDLWQRRVEDEDFMKVSLGYGNEQMRINIKYPEEHFSMEEDNLKSLVIKLGSEEKILDNVPITFSLRENNILALIGNLNITENYIKKILLQLIAYHSYDNLKIVILTNEDNQYYWKSIKSLPHLYNNEKNFRYYGTTTEEYKEILYHLDSIYQRRVQEKHEEKSLYNPYYLIITDCFKSIRNFEIINSIFDNKNSGFSMIILNDRVSTLPDQCQNFISLNNTSGELFKTILNNESKKFKQDNIPIALDKCSKILANIPIEYTITKEGQMPNKIGFLEMFNVGKIEQLNIENRWITSNPILSLNAPVGIGKSGEKVSIDLHEKYHGPHGLVAGMTGSGKSEFLITYILSMAINYHPYEVQFILIDYKGGGLAGAFENQLTGIKLPHLVGTITNLDKNEIKRSLASIESELKRRQRMFNIAREQAGESTIDIYKYQKLYREGIIKEPISHLFIISDEFAELKAQEPEFMDQLISTARIGRSLGVHLILATQKPSGVVNAQIWSNTRFRVCLRVQDTSDSNEVIKCPDAAYLTQTGRFYFQVGQNEIFTIGQASYCGTPYIPTETIKKEIDNSINILNNNAVSIKNIDEDKKITKIENKGEELLNIVTYLNEIGKNQNINVTPLWLPKIPELIYIENIKKRYNYKPISYNFTPVIGLYDDPNSQQQGIASINLTKDGNTIIYGMSGSGEELLLGTFIYSLSIEHTPNEVNIYAIDCGSETLTMYKKIPHMGDVALINDTEKINNLFKMVSEEAVKRKKLFVEYNGEYNYYCKNSGNKLPALVIIISSFDAFKETYEDLEENLKSITRDCIKYGIYFVLTTSNSNGVRSTIKQNFNNNISLQLTDETAYSYIFGNIRKLAPSPLVGRGLLKIDQVYEFQTAHVVEDEKQIEYIKQLSDQLIKLYPNQKAKKIPVLPEIVVAKEIIDDKSSLSNLPIGVDKNSLETINYNFTQGKVSIIMLENEENIPKVLPGFINLFNIYSKLIIIDMHKILEPSNNYMLINETNIEEQMNNIINLAPGTENYFCIIIGLNNMLSKISDKAILNLSKFFGKQAEENSSIHFALLGTEDMIKGQEFEPWYKKCIENKSGIYIGNGIDNQNVLKVENSYKLSKIKLTTNFALIIKKGNVNLVKIVEQ